MKEKIFEFMENNKVKILTNFFSIITSIILLSIFCSFVNTSQELAGFVFGLGVFPLVKKYIFSRINF